MHRWFWKLVWIRFNVFVTVSDVNKTKFTVFTVFTSLNTVNTVNLVSEVNHADGISRHRLTPYQSINQSVIYWSLHITTYSKFGSSGLDGISLWSHISVISKRLTENVNVTQHNESWTERLKSTNSCPEKNENKFIKKNDIKWGMVKTATSQNGDTKTATDCPDQNGDKLKRRQAKRRQTKTATGAVCWTKCKRTT